MALFEAINPAVEVNGQTVFAIAEGMGAMKSMGMRLLADNGIENPKPEEWYPQQNWLNAFRQISDKIGGNTLRMIGRSIPENADFPPDIDNIEKALGSIDVAYHMNHRLDGNVMFNPENGSMQEGIGHYHFNSTGAKSAEVKCDNPYPCEFDIGIVEAMAKRFKPTDSINLDIEHDESAGCRKNGDDACTYRVKW